MEEKITAVYLLVWKSELLPEDGESFERPLEAQKRECFEFLRAKGIDASKAMVYTSRKDLLTDVERDRLAALVVHDLNRLGASNEDVQAILFESQNEGSRGDDGFVRCFPPPICRRGSAPALHAFLRALCASAVDFSLFPLTPHASRFTLHPSRGPARATAWLPKIRRKPASRKRGSRLELT